jgi:hypothetical protein
VPTVALKDLPKVLSRQQERIFAATVRGMQAGAQAAIPHLRKATPKDRGHAKAAWHWKKVSGNGPLVATAFNDNPIIGILENGARPHGVSKEGQEAIYEWVLRNMRMIGGRKEGYAAVHGSELHEGQRRRTFKSVDSGEALARQITFLICRKIRKYGQKPHFFVRELLPLLSQIAHGEVERCHRELSNMPDRGAT